MKKIIRRIKKNIFFSRVYSVFNLGGSGKNAPSSLTYYLLLSMVPFLTIEVYILRTINVPFEDFLTLYQTYFGENELLSQEMFSFIFSFSFSSSIEWIVLVGMTIYFSSVGVERFIEFINDAYRYELSKKNFFIKKIRYIIITLLLCVVFAFLLYFFIFFNNIVNVKNIVIASIIKQTIFLIFLFLFFDFLYALSTKKQEKLLQVAPGAFFSSLGVGIGLNVYSYILRASQNKEKIYGPFKSIIVLLLTIYFLSYVVLMGVRINILCRQGSVLKKRDNKNH